MGYVLLSVVCPCRCWVSLQSGVAGWFLQKVACFFVCSSSKIFCLSLMQPFAVMWLQAYVDILFSTTLWLHFFLKFFTLWVLKKFCVLFCCPYSHTVTSFLHRGSVYEEIQVLSAESIGLSNISFWVAQDMSGVALSHLCQLIGILHT